MTKTKPILCRICGHPSGHMIFKGTKDEYKAYGKMEPHEECQGIPESEWIIPHDDASAKARPKQTRL